MAKCVRTLRKSPRNVQWTLSIGIHDWRNVWEYDPYEMSHHGLIFHFIVHIKKPPLPPLCIHSYKYLHSVLLLWFDSLKCPSPRSFPFLACKSKPTCIPVPQKVRGGYCALGRLKRGQRPPTLPRPSPNLPQSPPQPDSHCHSHLHHSPCSATRHPPLLVTFNTLNSSLGPSPLILSPLFLCWAY